MTGTQEFSPEGFLIDENLPEPLRFQLTGTANVLPQALSFFPAAKLMRVSPGQLEAVQ